MSTKYMIVGLVWSLLLLPTLSQAQAKDICQQVKAEARQAGPSLPLLVDSMTSIVFMDAIYHNEVCNVMIGARMNERLFINEFIYQAKKNTDGMATLTPREVIDGMNDGSLRDAFMKEAQERGFSSFGELAVVPGVFVRVRFEFTGSVKPILVVIE